MIYLVRAELVPRKTVIIYNARLSLYHSGIKSAKPAVNYTVVQRHYHLPALV